MAQMNRVGTQTTRAFEVLREGQKQVRTQVDQKALKIGLAFFALFAGVELARQDFFDSHEIISLLTMSQVNVALGVIGYGLYKAQVAAQITTAVDEFQVNTYWMQDQQRSQVAGLTDGKFVVAWDSTAQEGNLGEIYGQKYFANATRDGSEFRINTNTISEQRAPSLAPLQGGRFVTVWYSQNEDAEGYGIFGQIFDANGVKEGIPFLVNSFEGGDQLIPCVGAIEGGGFIVTWHSDGQSGNTNDVYGQVFDDNGNRIRGEFQANNVTMGEQYFSNTIGLKGGGYVITWESVDQDGDGQGIYAKKYSANGTSPDLEFRVNTQTTGNQKKPRGASLETGGFVIVWDGAGPGDGGGVFGQLYDENASPIGGEFLANTNVINAQETACIAGLDTGGFVVLWRSFGDGDSFGIFGQEFTSDGVKVNQEFQVNNETAAEQLSPSVAGVQPGKIAATWSSNNQDGDRFGVYGKLYSASGTPSESIPISTSVSTPAQTLGSSSIQRTAITSSSTHLPPRDSSTQEATVVSISAPTSGENSTLVSLSSSTSQMLLTSPPTSDNLDVSSSIQSSILEETVEITSDEVYLISVFDYSTDYSITLNGEVIGSFIFSGGTGQVSPENPNVLTITIDSDVYLEDGERVVLFTLSEYTDLDIVLVGVSTECRKPIEEIEETERGYYEYSFSIESRTCAPASIAVPNLLPLIVS